MLSKLASRCPWVAHFVEEVNALPSPRFSGLLDRSQDRAGGLAGSSLYFCVLFQSIGNPIDARNLVPRKQQVKLDDWSSIVAALFISKQRVV